MPFTCNLISICSLETETKAWHLKGIQHNLSLTGHCTDSASNALNALLMLATPTKYLVEELDVTYLELSRPDYFLFAPFFALVIPALRIPVGITEDELSSVT